MIDVARRKSVAIEVVDGAGVRAFADNMVLFLFDRENSRSMKGFVVDLAFAEKLAIQSVCLTSFFECLGGCGEECRSDGLDAECRQAFDDCLNSSEAFAEHAKFVYDRFLEKVKNEGGRSG